MVVWQPFGYALYVRGAAKLEGPRGQRGRDVGPRRLAQVAYVTSAKFVTNKLRGLIKTVAELAT